MAYNKVKMKKKFHIVMMIFMFPLFALGQTNTGNLKRLSVGLSFEEAICFRQLNYSSSNEFIAKLRNNDERFRFGFTTGVNLRYRLNDKILIESGVLYSNTGFQTKEKELSWATPSANLANKTKTVFVFKTLALPVKANYSINISKLQTYLTAGVSFNYLLRRKTTVIDYFAAGNSNKTSDNQNIGFKPFSFSFIGGFGINYPVSHRLFLNIEPVYRQGVSSVNTDKSSAEYLYSAGINASVFYNFRKREGK
jgi:opacity protein-like surface antigen